MFLLYLFACLSEDARTKAILDTAVGETGCNGKSALCPLPFNQAPFVGTHNSMSNAEDEWIAPNQGWNIPHQLEAGVRALNLDTYEIDGSPVLCHGFCELGEQPLEHALSDVRDFLIDQPQNVILITFQDAAPAEMTLDAFHSVGIGDWLHVQPLESEWPSLQELIDSDKRLVVFAAQYGGPATPGYHAQWDYWIDTPYQAQTTTDFSCEADRGNIDTASLFNVNHFITNPIALPEHAEVANTANVITNHIEQCLFEREMPLTQILVDFVDIGDTLEVIDNLNPD